MRNPTGGNFTPATLTPAQLDSAACVRCGGTDGPMTPLGRLDGVQLFACTDHAMPCMSWCIGQHDPGAPELCTAPEEPTPGSDLHPAESIGLSYTPDTGVIVAIGDKYMTLAQARGYALALMRQLDRARQAAPFALEGAA